MPAGLTEQAPAKVNLYLHVTGRRADGYHLLDSLAVFPAVCDTLRVTPAEALSLTLEGRFGALLRAEPDNLVLRAARALAEAAGIAPRARMVLTKNLPVASGIGGGSADAAAALRGLARLWGVAPACMALAARLGADVPACLAATPARMGGVGEVLSPAPALPPCWLVLINPGVAVATPAVFRARVGGFSTPAALPAGWPDFAAMVADLARLANDLESPAISVQPAIAEVLTALRAQPGCALARMSGSGATCFGLFGRAAAAAAAAAALARPGWWSWGGGLERDRLKWNHPKA
jgi:4-diphosphocytidyl-2-C-methyl-D-erythritol kinase